MKTDPDVYDFALVGTGPASTFFLQRLQERKPQARVIVLERGERDPHAWRLENRLRLQPGLVLSSVSYRETFVNASPAKPWVYTPSFGGGSNCWTACTPRMLPNDFQLKTAYGVGEDWPIDYGMLEPFYARAEEVMQVSGPEVQSVWRRSTGYPQPPHELSSIDRALQKAFPGLYFAQPTARPTRATSRRPACCGTGVCCLCPIDAKFTIQNELAHLYEHPGVTLKLGAQALHVETQNGVATGVVYRAAGRERRVRADTVVLGANALFNPHLLLRSGVQNPALGRYLGEQVGVTLRAYYRGLKDVGGSTAITANGFMFYDGEHRRERAAALVESVRSRPLRLERGRFQEVSDFRLIFEDLPSERNHVGKSSDAVKPSVRFEGCSDYTKQSIKRAVSLGEELLKSLPLEKVELLEESPTEFHILGTARMGKNPETSVVDAQLVHHQIRNLLVLGGSAFPSFAPANPTLTIAALSLLAAERYA